MPGFKFVDVKLTAVPAQIVFAEAAIAIEGTTFGFTVTKAEAEGPEHPKTFV